MTHFFRRAGVLAAILVALAPWAGCGDDDGGGGNTDAGVGGDGAGGGGDYDGDGIPDDQDPDDDNDGVPDGEDECPMDPDPCGSGGDESCRHIDLVISVDGSSSMNEEMAAMGTEVFPGFADALLGIADGLDDYRVGVLDACADEPTFNATGEPGMPAACTASDSDQGSDPCNFASGQAWIEATPATDPDAVKAEFRCVGQIDRVQGTADLTVGTCSGNNDDERPTQAAIAALQPGVNPGFLREDAILVVIAVTDEDEHTIPNQSAQAMYDALVAAKGDVKDMVFLGIGGGPGGCTDQCPANYGSADAARKLHALTDLFIAQDRGVWWNLCDGDLGSGLAQALDVIEQACDDFVE
jgi:hypothetical protein